MEITEGKQLPRHVMKDFLQLYRSFPCLWDSKDKGYMNKYARNEAYQVLVNKCREVVPSADIEFVKKKINSYRSTFRKEYLKVRSSSKKNGSSGEDVYEPSLWYYDLLLFLFEGHEGKKVKRCLDSADEQDNSSHTVAAYEDAVDSPMSHQSHQYHTVTGVSSNKNKKRARHDRDEYELFGQLVAAKLRVMDMQQRIFAEKVIADSLFLGQMGYLTSSVFTEPTLGFALPSVNNDGHDSQSDAGI